ncbi:hypothetical protein KNU94_gp43 [Xanthomonas phage FoX2]|uniref:Uncharacterized protein n=1 Tax=Xanthomonas phage FoX2 TaxID=2723898 RepID=A0A858NMZ3_9CAUD|nr:hypothetical protein KNU94_gp43 [Xanthomonas phage FoX2]QJB21889.1 hypothetical protein XccvBFoX2_gp70 [Xanthomonas phage FoX2]
MDYQINPPANPQATRRIARAMRIRLAALIAFWGVFAVVVANRAFEIIGGVA